jgi:hypothetical protein
VQRRFLTKPAKNTKFTKENLLLQPEYLFCESRPKKNTAASEINLDAEKDFYKGEQIAESGIGFSSFRLQCVDKETELPGVQSIFDN